MEQLSKFPCDLHMHTTRSDGADTPVELIDHAAEIGMKIIAITDHDVRPPENIEVSSNVSEITSYADSKGLILLNGIEISCETAVEDVHIVCFGCDWNDAFFDEIELSVSQSKVKAYRALVDALCANGMPLTWDEVLANGGNPVNEQSVQKKMIFELIARKGYARDWQSAKLMVKNTPAFQIKRHKPGAVNVIREIKRMGGVCILAHPFLIAEEVELNHRTITRKGFINQLIHAGLDGIEACYTYDKTSYNGKLTKAEIARLIERQYAECLPIISGGSDYHADQKKGIANPREIGEAGITYEYFRSNPLLVKLIPEKICRSLY